MFKIQGAYLAHSTLILIPPALRPEGAVRLSHRAPENALHTQKNDTIVDTQRTNQVQ